MLASTSSNTLSGTGRMVAISSMLRNLFAQLTSVVCLRPVSPPTQYATGSADRTGNRTWARPTGTRRNMRRTADCSVALPSMTLLTSSGMSAAASVRLVRFVYAKGGSLP
jgi:hypothetical protein